MRAVDIMTRRVISVAPDASVHTAIRLMLQNRISGLPVVDAADRLVGILSEGDLLRRAETGTQRHRPRWLEFLVGPGRLADEYVGSHGRKVSEVMTASPISIVEDTPLEEIVALMERRNIKRAPVVRDGKLVGIVSRANLIQALASYAHTTQAGSVDDVTIRDKILDEMEQQPWAPKGLINVIVKDGVVSLWGTITDEREREALHVLAENTAGVKEVIDQLAWVEPMSGMLVEPLENAVQSAKAS